ncbi:MAG TPA: sulfatase-like hydrolase/transferase [Tepidisphaeraceae bacterium]|jgi:arylsulfatase A-like enzyme
MNRLRASLQSLCRPIALLVVAIAFQSQCRAAEQRPNILLILTDDQGYADLTAYGAKDMRTPNMDALIARGMRFNNFYANSPVCSPSRAAIMTGRYPDRVGMPGLTRTDLKDNWGYLSHEAVLLPSLLHKAGYHTAIVGKWNLGLEPENTPNRRGFDVFHGFLGDMMDNYLTHLRQGHNYMRLNDQEIDPKGHATDLFTQWAIEYLHEREAPAKKGKPFFLYLAYNAPHVPTQPPAEWLDRVKKREAGIDQKRAGYVALIEHLDDGIGKVLAALKDAGLEENTLIIFTSDNGGLVGQGSNVGGYRGTKGTMYEGGLRVPMAAVWPGHITPNSHSDAVSLHMDLFATACDVAGATRPPEVDGSSILSILTGNAPSFPANRALYFVRREGGAQFFGLTSHALRRGDWKLLQTTPFSPLELYNLKDDRREEHDLIATQPIVRNQMTRLLQSQIQRAGSVPWQKPISDVAKQ